MIDSFQFWIDNLLKGAGATSDLIPAFRLGIMFFALVLIAFISLLIAKYFIVRLIHSFFARTTTKWDDILVQYKVFDKVAHIIPAFIVKALAPVVFADFQNLLPFISKVTDIYILIVIVMIVMAVMKGAEFILSSFPLFKNKPLASYFQLSRIIIYIGVAVLVLSILMGRSPLYFLSAFGAMTAILLLVFKDTILGLVASVQISSNDMIRVGDWVEMPKYNADGDVLAINLNTVKIKNWDKTITTVPTFYFITDSFKNWRGMQESGGRRIKRSLYINKKSIKFVDQQLKERFERFYLVKDYVKQRQKEIDEFNAKYDFDSEEMVNGRRMTNIGVFREYITTFLRSHKGINQEMFVLVRQLQPDSTGLPVEIYCFTKSVAWADYEGVQADIFDHLLAAASHFDLEVFQAPSGSDIIAAGERFQANLPGAVSKNLSLQ